MITTKSYLVQALLIFLILTLSVCQTKAQNNSAVFEEYHLDEFTGEAWITAKALPNKIETKVFENLTSVDVKFNFKRKPNDKDELVGFSELWIVMNGVVKEFDYEREFGESCVDGLSQVYFLADGNRIKRDICYIWRSDNSTAFVVILSEADLLKIGTSEDIKFRVYGNVIDISDRGGNILNKFTDEVKQYF